MFQGGGGVAIGLLTWGQMLDYGKKGPPTCVRLRTRGAPTTARRYVAAPRHLPPLSMAYDEYDINVSHVNGVA